MRRKSVNVKSLAPPRQWHSDTSCDAADRIEPKAPTLRQQVLHVIRELGGLTDAECQQVLHLDPSTQRPRRIELVRMGLVVDSGETRKTKSGRKATVWRST